MALIAIPGISEESILNQDTTPKGGGLRPFPCDEAGWTQHTAFVVKASIKQFDNGNDSISIVVANEAHGAEILIGLDPSRTAPGLSAKQQEKAQADNLRSLQLAMKILGCHTNGKLDTVKLEKAHGQYVTLIARHKGFQEKDGKYYHKVTYILTGAAEELLDLKGPALPPLPGQPRASSGPADPLGNIW